jgi:hypothetical protein
VNYLPSLISLHINHPQIIFLADVERESLPMSDQLSYNRKFFFYHHLASAGWLQLCGTHSKTCAVTMPLSPEPDTHGLSGAGQAIAE